MFEAAQLGRKLAKAEFDRQEPELHTLLLDAQLAAQEQGIPVIVIISGVPGSGKSEVVSRLHEWLDTRGIETHAFWDETDEERQRPRFWRFWRRMPPRGRISIMFGSWYTQPIIEAVEQRGKPAELDRRLVRIADFERMLTQDGALVVKFWFHLSHKTQARRLKKKGADTVGAKTYDKYLQISERAIRATDTDDCPWYLIEAEEKRYRDFSVGKTLLNAISERLQRNEQGGAKQDFHNPLPGGIAGKVTILDHVDLKRTVSDAAYKKQLAKYQQRLDELAWRAYNDRRSTVLVLEGWDAAGKGGVIRRLTYGMDPRLYQVVSVGTPTDEELAHHYLWRFWRHMPRDGRIRIYDRSWYGRVLVERVEGFAADNEWKRAYMELNAFEEQLCDHGVILLKYWLHISPEEQLRRFKEREQTPWKRHKITEEDWRNREKWDDYKQAVNDMVEHTSTAYAPWHIVSAESKKSARIEVLKQLCDAMEQALK